MALGLVHFDPSSFPPEAMPCLRCGAETMLRFAGPCAACVQELRSTFRVEARVIEGDDFVPMKHVTPNTAATQDDSGPSLVPCDSDRELFAGAVLIAAS